MAQIVNQGLEEDVEKNETSNSIWNPPPQHWLKCNVGCAWSKHIGIAGASWILRDEKGHVILHSRRTFSRIGSKRDANFKSAIWAIEAMSSHHFDKVVFALEAVEIVGAVNRPKAWPSFAFQSAELLLRLQGFLEWNLVLESHIANRGASLIAQSASSYNFVHSYVESGPPSWLLHFFENERSLASVYGVC
ncbi:hypothetical protein V5N11_035558 [Cardamine amara subsp. amara]|uniref:RNase H type-1 domain-containing protein n=1 Tax=Cardamine amara subsp. amara TaxID=228776 RepID=A0ABD0ZD63_CARAN